MEFQFKKHVKIVVDFEVGERVLIEGFGSKVDGEHTIIHIKEDFDRCESGIKVIVSGYGNWLDIGWLTKIEPSKTESQLSRKIPDSDIKYFKKNTAKFKK